MSAKSQDVIFYDFLFTGIQMLSMLVPILVSCLLEGPTLKEANKYCRGLHENCLQLLMKIGPQYPQVLQWLNLFYYFNYSF